MPTKSYLEGFSNSNLLLDPFTQFPIISDDIQQTLARQLGFDYNLKLWKPFAVDTDGRLLVTTSPTKTGEANNSNADVALVSVLLLSANPTRKQYILANTGNETVYLTFDATAIAASGIPLAPDSFFSDDIYTGAVSAIALVGSNNVRIAEF